MLQYSGILVESEVLFVKPNVLTPFLQICFVKFSLKELKRWEVCEANACHGESHRFNRGDFKSQRRKIGAREEHSRLYGCVIPKL